MKTSNPNRISSKLLLGIPTFILLCVMVLEAMSGEYINPPDFNPYVEYMPQGYSKLISGKSSNDSVFLPRILNNHGLRELLIFKKSPSKDELETDFIIDIYLSQNTDFKSTKSPFVLNLSKDAVMYNHEKQSYGVFKLALPIVDIDSLKIRQKPIKNGNSLWTELIKQPFKKSPNLKKTFPLISKNIKVTHPNPYSFIYKTVLEQYEVKILPSSFRFKNDSLLVAEENITEYSLRLGQPIVEIRNPYLFWELATVYDNSMINQMKVYGNDQAELNDLINQFLEEEKSPSAVFDISKLTVYNALQKVFCNECIEPIFFIFNKESMLLEPLYKDSNCLGKVNKVLKKSFIDDSKYIEVYIKALNEFSKMNFYNLIERKKDAFIENLSLINGYYINSIFDFSVIEANQKVIQKSLNPSSALKSELISVNDKRMTISAFNVSNYPIEVLGLYHNNDKEITILNQLTQIPSKGKTIINIDLPRSFENLFVSKKKKITGFVLPKHIYELRIKYEVLGLNEIYESNIIPYQQDTFEGDDLFRSKTVINDHKHILINEESHEITFSKDSIVVSSPLVIPKNYVLKLNPGAIINIIDGGKIISNSPLNFVGSKKSPIKIYSSDKKGEGVLVLSESKKSILKHVNFDHLENLKHGNWSVTGAVTFYESPVDLEYVTFRNNRSEDALNIVRTDFVMKQVTIANTQSDAFDGDFVTGAILDCKFDNLGNDAIDVSGSDLTIENVVISHAGDKGLSAGENSKMKIDTVEISNSEIAVAGKDLSVVEAKNLKILNTKLGFTAFQKKPEFGPSKITVTGIVMEDIETKYLIESSSSLFVDDRKIETTQNVKDRMYGVEFGVSSEETRNRTQ